MSSIEDYFVPNASIKRIFKESVPEGYKLQKEAQQKLNEICVVFVNYLVSTYLKANKVLNKFKKKQPKKQ